MNQHAEVSTAASAEELAGLAPESHDTVVLSTHFEPEAKSETAPDFAAKLAADSVRLLDECARLLKPGGLLFVYGMPRELAFWGEHLSELRAGKPRMIFKYWIALDVDDVPAGETLKPTHLGLMVYLKNAPDLKKQPLLRLNTDDVRTPHLNCAACGRTLKDWGGKKHLMNPKGAALSDVWRDLPRRKIRDSVIPEDVLARVMNLAQLDGGSYLHVVQSEPGVERSADAFIRSLDIETRGRAVRAPGIEPDQVLEADCIEYLKGVAKSHPDGLFDLAFADPPYNLKKLYGQYDDTMAEQQYINWCNRWLDGMARTLKPGGSLFVVNLPKWTIHHAAFLSRRLEFRHWIVWDALSDPRGKLMPAHYGLLWFTKPGAKPVCNYQRGGVSAERRNLDVQESAALRRDAATDERPFVLPPDSPKYCLRAACIKERKSRGDDVKVELTDVWFDIHRIKHKRDRDAHPCQLPEKLMDRIIRLTTRPGDLVFDPFCGAGTTAIAATRLGRKFVVTDLDADYVRITREKLAAMKQNNDLFGSHVVPRASIKKPKRATSKREVELFLQSLARKLGRAPTVEDVESENAEMMTKIDAVYPNRGAALKRAKVVLGA
jgi:DNA modification methylase